MTNNLIPVGKRFPRYSKNIDLKTVVDLKTNKNVESLVCKDGEERVFIQNYLNEWEGIECKLLFPETKKMTKAMTEYFAHLKSKGYEILDSETVFKPGMLFKVEINDDGSPKGLKCIECDQ